MLTSPQLSLENMDARKSVFHNESVSPLSLMTDISSVIPNTHVLPRHRKWKYNFYPPPPLNLESIEEERGLSEYDCGYLDLGAETPNSSNSMQLSPPFHLPVRRRSFRRASPASANRLSKYAVDRDCGIWYAKCALFSDSILNLDPYSFEYAVVPCRTLCCGKVFCTEHLADVRTLFLLDVLFLNPFNSGYMDLKQKDAVLIVKTLAHLQAARFHLHRQLYILPRKPNAKAFLKQSILHHQLLSSCIWMTH